MSDKNCHEVRPADCELITVQCNHCGFHLGLDATFLRNSPLQTQCPGCGLTLEVEEIE